MSVLRIASWLALLAWLALVRLRPGALPGGEELFNGLFAVLLLLHAGRTRKRPSASAGDT